MGLLTEIAQMWAIGLAVSGVLALLAGRFMGTNTPEDEESDKVFHHSLIHPAGCPDDCFMGIDLAYSVDKSVIVMNGSLVDHCRFDDDGRCWNHEDCIHDNRNVNFI